jgi:hypothetical protein
VDKIEVKQYFSHGLIEQTWILHILHDDKFQDISALIHECRHELANVN